MDEMSIRVAVAQGGVKNTRPKTAEYASLAAFVREWEEPTPIQDNSPESKKGLPYFVGGVVSGKRHDSNVIERTLLTLDIEAPPDAKKQPPRPQVVSAALKGQGVEFWLYTTASHETAKPRYRIVLPLAKPLPADADTLRTATLEAAALAGVADWCASESWVLSQPMYLPATVDGTPPKTWRNTGTRFAPSGKATSKPTKDAPTDIPDAPIDPVLRALQRAGLYLREDAAHKGKHYITCPWDSEHGKPTAGDGTSTQTVYYEAHHDGNPRPAAHCLDTAPDEGGKPHLTYRTLVNWLRENGHLAATEENADTEAELEDPDAFLARVGAGTLQDTDMPEREWAWEQVAPVGTVTVLVGAGGSSKSALILRMLYEGAFGRGLPPFALGLRTGFRALYVTYEDDRQELNKRLNAMRDTLRDEHGETFDTLYGTDHDVQARLNATLFTHALDAVETRGWQLAHKEDPRSRNVVRTARVDWLVSVLQRGEIRVLVLDPAGMTHGLDENDPADMAEYMRILSDIARRANCAVVLVAHATKMTQFAELEDITQAALRGSSATADHARSVFVLSNMREKWAPRFGLPASPELPGRYAVLFHVKHNYSARLPLLVLERKGPIVVPRQDLQCLSRGELQAFQQEQKAAQSKEQAEMRRMGKVLELLGFLAGQPARTANATQITNAVFGKNGDEYGARQWCIDEGLVAVPEVKNGKPKPHTLTKAGAAYLEQ